MKLKWKHVEKHNKWVCEMFPWWTIRLNERGCYEIYEGDFKHGTCWHLKNAKTVITLLALG